MCSLGLRVVWCPKYRRRVLGGRVAARCGELVEQTAAEHGWEIVAKEVMPDHVHLFVRVGPTDAPARESGRSKGAPRGCYGLSFRTYVGYVSESTVRRYIEHQWDAVA